MALETTNISFINSVIAELQAGYKVGESQQVIREGVLRRLGTALQNIMENKSQSLTIVAAGNNGVEKAFFIAPHRLQLTGLNWTRHGSITGDPTLTVNNRDGAGDSDKNPLSTANVDLSSSPPTENESAALTLSGTIANLEMDKGDVLTFTVTNDADDAHVGIGFEVQFKALESFAA